MCLVGCAVPKGAVPLSVLSEVPSGQGPIRYMGSFVNSGLAEREWPRSWGVGLLSCSPVHGPENSSLATWVAS